LKLPTIVLLLVFGILCGPILGLVQPDELFGEILSPLIKLAVGIILYEGGLSLRFSEIPGVKRVIFSLISIGLLAAWLVISWSAQTFLGLDTSIAILLGAILTVSGPTVVLPLLRDVKPRAPLGTILKWEGILVDPVGATAAVLAFEVIVLEITDPTTHFAFGLAKTIIVGGGFGLAGAFWVGLLMKRYWIPDYLHNPISLGILFLVFTVSESLQHESGLLTATVMGIVLANMRGLNIRHLIEFKENLQVLLIAILFVVLSSRLTIEQVSSISVNGLIFLAIVILVARPLTVMLSTAGSELNWRERAFLAWVCPRGIVAAAVASLFSLELQRKGVEGADQLVQYTFLVIIGAAVIYGSTAGLVAKLLRVKQGKAEGVLFVGAHAFARALALELHKEGFKVLLVDSNWTNITTARLQGLKTYRGNILADYLMETLDLDGIGRLFALTTNDEANSLAAVRFAEHFGRAEVFQLPSETFEKEEETDREHPKHLRGRFLFKADADFFHLDELIEQGADIESFTLSQDFTYEDLLERFGDRIIPLVLVNKSQSNSEQGSLEVFTSELQLKPKAGQSVVALVKINTEGRSSGEL
jgi:NhaP-type Na+/H+ or K+/H+ antiporter